MGYNAPFPNSAEGWSLNMKKISLYIDEQLWHRFRIECVKRKTSASREVADLLEQQLQQWQLEDEKRAAPSGGCCSNPFVVYRKEPMLDGPLDVSVQRRRHTRLNPGIASSTRWRLTTPRDPLPWLLAKSLPPGSRQG